MGRHSAASAIPGLDVLCLHPLPCLPSDLASGQCQWPGPRSIDLCFRFSAEACQALGHWATVLSPANFHQSFAPPGAGAGTELARAGPGPENEVPCTRPDQGHEAPAPGSDGHAVLQCSLQHCRTAVSITRTPKTTNYSFTVDTLVRSISPVKPLMTDIPLHLTIYVLTMTSS